MVIKQVFVDSLESSINTESNFNLNDGLYNGMQYMMN